MIMIIARIPKFIVLYLRPILAFANAQLLFKVPQTWTNRWSLFCDWQCKFSCVIWTYLLIIFSFDRAEYLFRIYTLSVLFNEISFPEALVGSMVNLYP